MERTGWYNNCLCGRGPATSAPPGPWVFGDVKYFQAVVRCELDWNRKSWQGAQQLNKDKRHHRWCPCKTPSLTPRAYLNYSSLMGLNKPCYLVRKGKNSFTREIYFSPPCAFASQTSAGKDERIVSLSVFLCRWRREGKVPSSGIWHGSTEMGAAAWICDLLWSLCLLPLSVLTLVTIVFSSEPTQP